MTNESARTGDRPQRRSSLVLALAGIGAALVLVTMLRLRPPAPAPALQPPTSTAAAVVATSTRGSVPAALGKRHAATELARLDAAPRATPIPYSSPVTTAPPTGLPPEPDSREDEDEEVAVPVPATPTEDAYPGVRAHFAPTATTRPYP